MLEVESTDGYLVARMAYGNITIPKIPATQQISENLLFFLMPSINRGSCYTLLAWETKLKQKFQLYCSLNACHLHTTIKGKNACQNIINWDSLYPGKPFSRSIEHVLPRTPCFSLSKQLGMSICCPHSHFLF